MQQLDRDLFGNPIEKPTPITAVIQSTEFENDEFRRPSDNWRSRREEEPERWDGLS